jgi:hypothetical protein
MANLPNAGRVLLSGSAANKRHRGRNLALFGRFQQWFEMMIDNSVALSAQDIRKRTAEFERRGFVIESQQFRPTIKNGISANHII